MKNKYEIITRSIIEMNGQRLFDTTTNQQWEIDEEPAAEGCRIGITLLQPPETQAPEVQDAFRLMELINRLFTFIDLRLDRNGLIDKILNKEEIKSQWEEVQPQLPDLIGDPEIIRQLVKKTNDSLRLLESEIQESLPHFILLLPFRTPPPRKFLTPSVLNQEEMVEISFEPTEKADHRMILQGEGKLYNESKLKKKYKKEIQPYTEAEFNYLYTFRTAYCLRESDNRLENSVTDITEQASKGYIYTNHIEVNRIEETGKEI